jgi:hypothetical protein
MATTQSYHRVTFANDNSAVSSATFGLPQVSILAIIKQKELAKKRRDALNSGKGYRAVGSHRRSIAKHTWVYSELAELCSAFLQGYGKKSIKTIAQEIHASFAAELNHIRHHQYRCAYVAAHCEEDEEEDEEDYEQPESRCHLPTLTAIELKLMDCLSLWFHDNSKPSQMHCDVFNHYKPSQMHCDVFNHLMLSKKHRAMICEMKSAAGAEQPKIKEETEQPEQSEQPKIKEETHVKREIWNVHPRQFVYEGESTFPPTKRRKLNHQNEEQNASASGGGVVAMDTDMYNVYNACNAIDEIASQVETREQKHQRDAADIAVSIAAIRQNQVDVRIMMGYLEDTHTGIGICQQRIDAEIEKIEVILAARNGTIPTMAAKFDPDHYQCNECSQMFDPRLPGYWLIGANERSEHEEQFYICAECMSGVEWNNSATPTVTPTTPRATTKNAHRFGVESDQNDHSSDDDEIDYDRDFDDEPSRDGYGYDHEEECS